MSETPAPLSRRRMVAGTGAVGAAAAVAAIVPAVRTSGDAGVEVRPAPDKKDGYQVTEHVLRYYETARV